MRWFLFVLAFLTPVFSFAQTALTTTTMATGAPSSLDQVTGYLPTIIALFSQGKYLALGGVITLIVCFILNQYIFPRMNLGPALTPVVAGFVGILAGVGTCWAGGGTLQQGILAIFSGSVAVHAWESVIQYFFAKADPTTQPIK